jgi:hypothetical protein
MQVFEHVDVSPDLLLRHPSMHQLPRIGESAITLLIDIRFPAHDTTTMKNRYLYG